MSDERAGRLGVRTARGDFERRLAAEVMRALQATGIHEMRAGDLCALVAVEDVDKVAGAIQLPGENA